MGGRSLLLGAVIALALVSLSSFWMGTRFASAPPSAGVATFLGQMIFGQNPPRGLDKLHDFHEKYGNSSDRAIQHISTDRPSYRPGEVLLAQTLTLTLAHRPVLATAGGRYRSEPTGGCTVEGPLGQVEANLYPLRRGRRGGATREGGEKDVRLWGQPRKGGASGASSGLRWEIPQDLSGGEYKLRCSAGPMLAPAERAFLVRRARRRKLVLSLDFSQDSYGFGETAIGVLRAANLPTEALLRANIEAVLRVDGKESFRAELHAHEDEADEGGEGGGRRVSVPLPESWAEGVGTLTLKATYGGDSEALTVTVPLVSRSMAVDVYPESGDLVQGVPGRVYVEASLPWGDEAYMEADICPLSAPLLDDGAAGPEGPAGAAPGCVATVTAKAFGRGVSSVFTPLSAGFPYELRLRQPKHLAQQRIPLPSVQPQGAGIQAVTSTTPAGKPVEVWAAANPGGLFRVALYQREEELASVRVRLNNRGDRTLVILEEPPPSPGSGPALGPAFGVLRVTLFSLPDDKPVAERLVFRHPPASVSLRITAVQVERPPLSGGGASSEVELPLTRACGHAEGGEEGGEGGGEGPLLVRPSTSVRLTVAVQHPHDDDEGLGSAKATHTPTHVNVKVVSMDSLGQGRLSGLSSPRLDAMAMLESDIRAINPSVESLLDYTGDGGGAVDHLLGTQGWRRFAFESPMDFIENGTRAHKGEEEQASEDTSTDAFSRLKVLGVGTEVLRSPFPFPGVEDMEDGEPLMMMMNKEAARGVPEMALDGMDMAAAAGAAEAGPVDMVVEEGEEGEEGGVEADWELAEGVEDVEGGEDEDVNMDVEPFAAGANAAKRRPAFPATRDAAPHLPGPQWKNFRVYAHRSKRHDLLERLEAEGGQGGRQQGGRQDFADTLYYNAGMLTDPDGEVEFEFDVSDALGAFLVQVDCVTESGRFGAGTETLLVRQAAVMEAAIPLMLTEGDVVLLPVVWTEEHSDDGSGCAGRGGSGGGGSPSPLTGLQLELSLEGPLGLMSQDELQREGGVGKALGLNEGEGQAFASWQQQEQQKGQEEDKEGGGRDGRTTFVARYDGGGGGGGAAGGVGAQQEHLVIRERRFVSLLVPITAPLSDSAHALPRGGVLANVSVAGQRRRQTGGKEEMAADGLHQHLTVRPRGIAQTLSAGGQLSSSSASASSLSSSFSFTVPADVVPGSLALSASVYPSPLGLLEEAVGKLVREPSGCFEQTSATTYPMVIALRYLDKHQSESNKGLRERALAHLQSGYKKLLAFESEGGGFEWFGRAPAHEALTAYGLLQFIDMVPVLGQVVDGMDEVVQRTKKWILGRRDGEGGFKQDKAALDGFGYAPAGLTDAYIIYSLVSAGLGGGGEMDREIDALWARVNALSFKDPYELGLAAATMFADGRREEGRTLARRLKGLQAEDGAVGGAETSITSSRNTPLVIETTAIALLAWLTDEEDEEEEETGEGEGEGEWVEATEKGVRWLAGKCSGGVFGSTQGTVLALKAILAYEDRRSSNVHPSLIELSLDAAATGTLASSSTRLDKATLAERAGRPLPLPTEGLLPQLLPGMPYTLRLYHHPLKEGKEEGEGGEGEARRQTSSSSSSGGEAKLPWSLALSWRVLLPPSTGAAPVHLRTHLLTAGSDASKEKEEASEGGITVGTETFARSAVGEAVDVVAAIHNASPSRRTGMVVAEIGLPFGLEPRLGRLSELRRAGQVAAFEVREGNVVTLYWDGLEPAQTIQISFDCLAASPGLFRGSSSRAYEYYNGDDKHWVEGMAIAIAPQATNKE